MVVGVYKYGFKYPRRRRFASREREKIKKYR